MRAALIYSAWAVYRELHWQPGTGWLTAHDARLRGMGIGSAPSVRTYRDAPPKFITPTGRLAFRTLEEQRLIPRGGPSRHDPPFAVDIDLSAIELRTLAMGIDMGSPGGDKSVVAFRRGDHITFHEIPPLTPEREKEIAETLKLKSAQFYTHWEAAILALFYGK